ncbi:tumor necrosis factor ligand superfamily member 18 [Caretta caretta]|uniref:tumor necrosis factor ligand superfamily member 18 n=1 Tax=Caretta caretta TaxID=8467 RepID=UPI0020950E82|nr:tumor necrosis factor ligand superfamily member 18 isoform X2 [Caretta caretta]
MEMSNFLENGNIPREANNSRCNGMNLCTLAALALLILVVVPLLIACFLCLHSQSPEICWAHATLPSEDRDGYIIWKWNLTDCSSFIRNGSDQKLEILQSGMYFIYAQVTRIKTIKDYFTMTLYRDQNILLNQMTGTNSGEDTVSINFGRPYFLSKGEKLFCKVNNGLGHISTENQTYWGLYKM